MRVVLWDTRRIESSKDFAGGMGVGLYPRRSGLRNRIVRWFYTRDYRPTALVFAHLAAAMRRLGHQVRYVVDRPPDGADVYIFCPSLQTMEHERSVAADLMRRQPEAVVLVVGAAARVMADRWADLPATLIDGEPEQLHCHFDRAIAQRGGRVDVGAVDDLDALPLPDWSPFEPRRFRIGYDFTRFPTALIQASRGCSFRCNYCPYVMFGHEVRTRSPEAVVDEIQHDVFNWGFRSFKFRDPLWGRDRDQVYRLADLIGRLPQPIEFSIESRIEYLPPEVLRVLRRVGLTSVTVGLETPNAETLRRYRRAGISDDRQAEFIATCRRLGIRTVAGFMIGFPEDTDESIRGVLDYALRVNPTFANFNIVTPYPGTPFFGEIQDRIDDFDFGKYNVYTPVLRYEHLTREQVENWHATCFRRFYFRWDWLRDNAAVLWPRWFAGEADLAQSTTGPGGHEGVPQPMGRAALRRRGLRRDEPHTPRSQ